MRTYQYEDQSGIYIVSEREIIKIYYSYWCSQMKKVGKEHLISEESCIEDFCVVHWAHEIKGL